MCFCSERHQYHILCQDRKKDDDTVGVLKTVHASKSKDRDCGSQYSGMHKFWHCREIYYALKCLYCVQFFIYAIAGRFTFHNASVQCIATFFTHTHIFPIISILLWPVNWFFIVLIFILVIFN